MAKMEVNFMVGKGSRVARSWLSSDYPDRGERWCLDAGEETAGGPGGRETSLYHGLPMAVARVGQRPRPVDERPEAFSPVRLLTIARLGRSPYDAEALSKRQSGCCATCTHLNIQRSGPAPVSAWRRTGLAELGGDQGLPTRAPMMGQKHVPNTGPRGSLSTPQRREYSGSLERRQRALEFASFLGRI